MLSQRIIVPIDHGNRNMKTDQFVFTSGIVESDCKPMVGEYLIYNGRYYSLTEQRIPYMRNKTLDERFFILTLFGIAMEAERKFPNQDSYRLQVELPIGLPPKHYGALYRTFQEYFLGRGEQKFIYKGREFEVQIVEVMAFPQDYAATMTIYPQIAKNNKIITIDIGGFTVDYLLLRNSRPDLSVCDSLELGVNTLCNRICSRINSEQDILLENRDIEAIINGEDTDYAPVVLKLVHNMTQNYVDDLFGTLRERGLDLKTGCIVFIGGGASLLRKYLEKSDKIGKSIFVEDICANAKGYEFLYKLKKGRV